jgi:SH3-like domain-containing protein
MRGGLCVLAVCLANAVWSDGRAQSLSGVTAAARVGPIQYEPGDIWADVRAWRIPHLGQAERSDAARAPQPIPSRVNPPADVQGRSFEARAAEASPRPVDVAGATRTVMTDARRHANVRTEPHPEAAVARTLVPSSTLTAFRESANGWVNVGDNEPSGWVHRSMLRSPPAVSLSAGPPGDPAGPPPEPSPTEVASRPAEAVPTGRTVVTDPKRHANVRAEPRHGAAVERSVPPSSTLTVFGESAGGWFQVGGDQAFGWVHRSMLRSRTD